MVNSCMSRATRCARTLMGLLCLALMLSACERSGNTPAAVRQLQPIATDAECHVCGMLITRFPGPKAQAFIRNRDDALKFCSTVDLFTWLLQPETAGVLETAYVHDMTGQDWDHPGESNYIDAASAWYVAGHDLHGAMGPTLASFKTKTAAEQFAQEHGGKVLAFSAIDLTVLAGLNDAGEDSHAGHRHE